MKSILTFRSLFRSSSINSTFNAGYVFASGDYFVAGDGAFLAFFLSNRFVDAVGDLRVFSGGGLAGTEVELANFANFADYQYSYPSGMSHPQPLHLLQTWSYPAEDVGCVIVAAGQCSYHAASQFSYPAGMTVSLHLLRTFSS